jgi:hypothetical protein
MFRPQPTAPLSLSTKNRPDDLADISGEKPNTECEKNRAFTVFHWALVVGFAVSAVSLAYLMGENRSLRTSVETLAAHDIRSLSVNGLPIADANAAVASEKFSMATGSVSEDSDGLFLLDHNSGLLQCQVMYPRTAVIGARFQANVAEALGTGGKGGSYLMLTGRVNFPRASNRPAAQTVVYVMDTATGNFACFGIPFNSMVVNSNQPQQGVLVLLANGSANPLIDRDK